MTTTTTFSPGDRVRVAHAPQSIFQGRTGTVEQADLDSTFPIGLRVDRAAQSIGLVGFRADELEPLPDPTDPTSIPTGEVPPITSADIPGLHVVSDSPVALVREPAVAPVADAPSSSQAGLASFVPLRETVPPEAARDVMAGAGIDLDVFDASLARARETAEEAADRPALAAYDDGHAQGHRDGLLAALRIVERFEARAAEVADAALLGDVRDAIQRRVVA